MGAIVTGGGSGIGAATVELLARYGANVLVVDRDPAAAAAVADATGQTSLTADVGIPAEWQRIRQAAEHLGALRYLHLNAGVNSGPQMSPLAELDDDRLFATLAVNMAGVVLGVRELAPLLEVSRGSVLVTSSLAALRPFRADPVYAATKAGMLAFVCSVSSELERRGIRINALCPTATDTPMLGEADRSRLVRAGVHIVAASTMAAAMVECLVSSGTGQVYQCVDDGGPELVPWVSARSQ